MRFLNIKRMSGWFACSVCMVIALLTGCGDFCLFCGGGGGGGGNGGDGGEICDNPFVGLEAYQAALNLKSIQVFDEDREDFDRISLAVVPQGMSFDYGSNRTANPGDVLVADQQGTDVYVYEYSTTTQTQRSLGVGVDKISGLALLHQEINQTTDVDLLFFSIEEENELYIYDLTGTSTPSVTVNPLPLGDILDTGFLASPTAIAVSADSNQATLFVLNKEAGDNSVVRLSVSLASWAPISSETIATMTESSRRLIDISYYRQSDTLHVSKKTVDEQQTVGWVYEIESASERTSSVNLNPNSSFIAGGGAPTGLTAAFTNQTGTTAKLLVLTEGDGQVLQYDIDSGGSAEAAFSLGEISQFPQAIQYDCTNERLVMIDIPLNPDLPQGARTLFEAFPTTQ